MVVLNPCISSGYHSIWLHLLNADERTMLPFARLSVLEWPLLIALRCIQRLGPSEPRMIWLTDIRITIV